MTTKTTLKILTLLMSIMPFVATAQSEKVESIRLGNMDNWMVREIKESFVIGGNTQYLYEITETKDTLKNNTPYKNKKSPWATSSVLATVSGITKGSVTVFPEKRDNGYAARLETRIEKVKVLGVININVLASGTIFLGEMLEPITDTKNPQSKLVTGIAFTKKPKALQFDYKVITGGASKKVNGMGSGTDANRTDKAEIQILLQKRWEDKDGNVHAKRIGTGWELMDKTVKTWQNKHRLTVNYGDISKQSYYASYMALRSGSNAYYTRNSKGKMVPIIEEGWGTADDEVTHLIVQFSSSNGGAYIGNTSSRLWVDNVGLVY
ncbi:PCMD domain-containing protein [Myroides marinus]|uniref:PCMD domain-containing protein n=1 Tax=Myroides marinus TaxID=703342 RepID=UPI00257703EB|nr:PCMD domain-containing protein [Myroides marinus]MDM1347090.1 PCMD domain-containing protein [Myroides marinus]MDM1350609.1 PCMD domain-containing protein [Myroides marinus]MDM1354329.1 PCMD domain-containing protein [Myroides marinus]MDM1357816.1 PCMD domain-containing protein [Myroides marinus]MDM1365250.1 PCMD domain-containing protein [Myroides marinus]